MKVVLQLFASFFFTKEEVVATLLIMTIINITDIINDTSKIFTPSKVGNSMLQINEKKNFFHY